MDNVHDRVEVGSEAICALGQPGLGVVHACKSPCHQRAVGYRGSLPKDHPNYLSLRQGNDLYLNIIDPQIPLFPDDLFRVYLPFAREVWDSGATLRVHCNQGESRAPSLAIVFLAKHVGAISNESAERARADFLQLFPRYMPGRGIQKYLSENWSKFDAF
ncbi:hypothetical protein F3089_02360 [Halospina sp. K52047b]|nr:hypothetical protein F3089_02360 [Halospina sp. K52047b]